MMQQLYIEPKIKKQGIDNARDKYKLCPILAKNKNFSVFVVCLCSSDY